MYTTPVFTAAILQDIQQWPQLAYQHLERWFALYPGLAYALIAFFALACILVLVLLYKTIPGVQYEIRLWLHKLFESGHRQHVLRVLCEEKVPIEIMNVKKGDTDQLGAGLLQSVRRNSILIKIYTNISITRDIKNKFIYCYYRPILHFTIRTNSFKTYAISFEQDRYGNDILRVKMPVKMEVQERRRYKRKRIRAQRTIMARVWLRDPDAGANGKFRFSQPSFQINVEKGLGNRAQERFFDVSTHGMRVGVHRSLVKDELRPDSGVCVEVRPFIKDDKRFVSFFLGGKIRHLRQAKSGMFVVGVQFSCIAVRNASPTAPIEWAPLDKPSSTRSFFHAIAQL